MAGRDAAPAGVVRSCTPGRTPEQPRRLLSGRLGSGHRGTRKREKPVARRTGAFLLLASALARHTPSLWGNGKRDGQTPSPTKPGADETWLPQWAMRSFHGRPTGVSHSS